MQYIWTTAKPDKERAFRWHNGRATEDEVTQPPPKANVVRSGRFNDNGFCLMWNPHVERYQRQFCDKPRTVRAICRQKAATTTAAPFTDTTTDTQTTPVPTSQCPDGFSQLISGVNKCYQAVTAQVTQSEAVAACNDLGPGIKLIEPKSAQEASYNFLGESYWIGVHDSNTENQFQYESDGSSVTFLNWHTGEPNNLGLEHCVLAFASGTWNDQGCNFMTNYVCEFDL